MFTKITRSKIINMFNWSELIVKTGLPNTKCC